MPKGKYGFEKGAYGSAKGVRAKAADLTKAQLKRAGAAKAAAKRTVAIGSTSRVAGKTLGPGGKPLTGSVKLASGRTAVYKAGKRVVNKPVSKDKPAPPPPSKIRKTMMIQSSMVKRRKKESVPSSAVSQRSATQTSRVQQKAVSQRPGFKPATFSGSKTVRVPAISQNVPKSGYTEKDNLYNKGRVTGGPQSRKNVPSAALTALALYPAAVGVSAAAKIASAGRAAGAGARQGIASLGRSGAPAAAKKAAAPAAKAAPTAAKAPPRTRPGVGYFGSRGAKPAAPKKGTPFLAVGTRTRIRSKKRKRR